MIFMLEMEVVVGSTENPVHMYQATLQHISRESQLPSFRREFKFVKKNSKSSFTLSVTYFRITDWLSNVPFC